MSKSTEPPVISQLFSQSWSLEDTQAYLSLTTSRPKDTRASDAALGIDVEAGPGPSPEEIASAKKVMEEWYANVYHPINEKLGRAIAGHLLHLAKQGSLVLPENSEAVNTRWLSAWKRLVHEKTVGDYYHDLVAAPHKDMGLLLSGCAHQGEGSPVAHEKILSKISSGTLSGGEGVACQNSGLRLYVEFNHWVPTLGTIDFSKGYNAPFVPLAPGQIKPPGIEHVVVDFPTGELLIKDWFRLDAFNQTVERARKNEVLNSLEPIAGVVERTNMYAKLGFVGVFVGNTSPSIVSREGRLDVGSTHERYEVVDGEGVYIDSEVSGDHLGSCSTDMWWTTIIDKKVLVDICSADQSRATAVAQVEALLEEYEGDVIKVQVPPGKYHLYFSGDPSIFEENFHSPHADLSGFSEPMFTLSPVELALTPKPVPPRSSGPRI